MKKLKSISIGADGSIIMIYPYNEILYFVIYQNYDGNCERIILENIENETRETLYMATSQKFH